MRSILSEKNLVVILFVLVLITFSIAQEETKKMEKIYSGAAAGTAGATLKNTHTKMASFPIIASPAKTDLQAELAPEIPFAR